MSDPYRKVKGGRLTFKGGELATTTTDKKKKRKHKKKDPVAGEDDEAAVADHVAAGEAAEEAAVAEEGGEGGEDIYAIDAAKKMKYEELFPVEAKRFGYDPKNKSRASKSVEDALDDRVKKKADRYCK